MATDGGVGSMSLIKSVVSDVRLFPEPLAVKFDASRRYYALGLAALRLSTTAALTPTLHNEPVGSVVVARGGSQSF